MIPKARKVERGMGGERIELNIDKEMKEKENWFV